MALIQYDYAIPPTSSIESPPSMPEAGDRIRLQGDPNGSTFDGIIMGVAAQDGHPEREHIKTLTLLVPDDQSDMSRLVDWLQGGGDLGIMLV